MPERHLILEGGYNVRDLGGYPTEDGHVTQWKTLIRAGNLDKISPSAQQSLIDYGVKTIVDLRDNWEIEKYPNVFAGSTSVIYRHLPLLGRPFVNSNDRTEQEDPAAEMYEIYAQFVAQCQPQIGEIMSAIADSEGCTLFHCYAGKDRTGIIAALILSAVGVSQTVIAEDYGLSEAQVRHLMEKRQADAAARRKDTMRFERLYAAKPHTMQTLLHSLDEQYGDVQGYLAQCGVSQSQIDRLRARFIC